MIRLIRFFKDALMNSLFRGSYEYSSTNYTCYYSYDNHTIKKLNLHTPKPPLIVVIRGQRRRAGARGIYAAAASLAPAEIRVA